MLNLKALLTKILGSISMEPQAQISYSTVNGWHTVGTYTFPKEGFYAIFANWQNASVSGVGVGTAGTIEALNTVDNASSVSMIVYYAANTTKYIWVKDTYTGTTNMVTIKAIITK